jgi:hypothetical protein
MLPGSTYVYQCPECENRLQRGSLASGNTFGSKLYSDGKMVAPMLREFPQLTICPECDHIFWINKLEPVDEFGWNDDDSELDDMDMADFLTKEEYHDALQRGVAGNRSEELYIRRYLLWTFNDAVRRGLPLLKTEDEKVIWHENLNQLIALLDGSNDTHEMILLAEVHRAKGDFDKCMGVLSIIQSADFRWIKAPFQRECNQQNQQVFLLRKE